MNIANNIIANGSGNAAEDGIYLTLCTADALIYSNTLTITPSNNSGNPCAIFDDNSGGDNVSIYSNIIQNCSFLSSGNWSFTAIKNSSGCTNLAIYANKIMHTNITNGSFVGIDDNRANATLPPSENIHNNEISFNTVTGTSGDFTGIMSERPGGNSAISNNLIFSNSSPIAMVGIGTRLT